MTFAIWHLGLALLIGGLIVVYLSSSVKQALLGTVVYWTGIVLAVIGLVLLITPVLIWLNNQFRAMLS